MGVFRSLSGTVRIELTSANIPTLLNEITDRNIPTEQVTVVDEITVRMNICERYIEKIAFIAKKRGDKLTVLQKEGVYWTLKRLLRRPTLLVGLAILTIVAMFLPTRILFVRVEGNQEIPSKQILEMAEECGISMFASRRHVRSEKVKNALLDKIPQLQWVGVNTRGCVATINVTEKSKVDDQQSVTGGVSSIVAARDGVVWDFTVVRGNALCQKGQIVKAGQVLVSGYKDCGIAIVGTRAEAEIFAKTLHDLQIVTPVIDDHRGEIIDQRSKYSILFGKKLIKLYKGSGISDTSCVKIYDEFIWKLPGGFTLPVWLIRETYVSYASQDGEEQTQYDWLPDAANLYLQSQMIAGQILAQDTGIEILDDICCLDGQYSCLEMIGQEKKEEVLQR